YSKTTGEQRDAGYIFQQGGNNISPIAELGFTWNGQNQLPQGANAYPSYSSDHEYEFGFAGNGLVQIISFSDGNYFDNTGSLHFELYEIGGSISWSTGDTSYHTMATPLNNTLYYVTVSNGINICTDEVKVSVSKVISSVDSTKDLSCNGGADGLAVVEFDSGNGPYQVEWLNSSGDTIRSVSSPTITDTAMNLVAGNYTLYFTDTVLCVDSLTFSLSEPSLLLYQIMDTTMVACKSDTNGSITITPFGGTPGYTYSWFPATLPTDSIIDSLVAGIYEITITDAKGCDTSASITISEPDTLKYSYIKYDDHCDQHNGTLDLSGVGGTSPFTFNTSGPGSTGVSGSQLTSLTHGDYYITITDANSCQYNDSLILDSIPNPDATISYTAPSLCLDTPVAFSANAIPSNSSISSWIWSVDIDYSNPNPNTWVPIYSSGQNISYFYSDTGAKEVKLTVTDIHGCKDTDTVVVNIYPLPVVDFYADTVWGCDTLSVSFYDRSQTIDTSTYYWDLGNSQTSTDSIALAYYSQTGVYDVSLTVTNPYGCSNSKTIQDIITVYKSPDAAFNFAPATTSNLGPPVDFFDASINAVSWSWNFGDTLPSSISNEQNPSHIYSDTGYMYVMLAIQSEETCKDTVYSSIYVKTYHSIFIPNVFTPNGDDINDVFIPVGMLQGIDEYSMHIYNRWGDRIFHTEDKYTAWNGAVNNDPLKLCQNGAYVYFIVARDNEGITTEYKGSVVLIADY
ncbi:MAG TPA: PKD domain-containing protein, partial [Bacteroidetes bacterium]|nr:PKD domain-containing protein [Bacteroidota bacterium]